MRINNKGVVGSQNNNGVTTKNWSFERGWHTYSVDPKDGNYLITWFVSSVEAAGKNDVLSEVFHCNKES